ncbi:MAG TPA: SurA N-terminal domain-containing protein [Streptomyces sp.]|nr:SurA N-terminal domain-containing protein [Streptomyces sp.]
MFRRRTSLFLSAAGAVLVAAPLLTACGSEAHPGAAAVVGGERITMSQVQARVEAAREAQHAMEEDARPVQIPEQLLQRTLGNLVFQRVLEQAAEDAGVTVTRRDVQLYREQEERSTGGAEQLHAVMLQESGVAPDEIDEVMRVRLLFYRLVERLGVDPNTPQGDEQLRVTLVEASKSLDISVNPRYGVWDDERIGLADSEEPWIKNVSNPAPEQPA